MIKEVQPDFTPGAVIIRVASCQMNNRLIPRVQPKTSTAKTRPLSNHKPYDLHIKVSNLLKQLVGSCDIEMTQADSLHNSAHLHSS